MDFNFTTLYNLCYHGQVVRDLSSMHEVLGSILIANIVNQKKKPLLSVSIEKLQNFPTKLKDKKELQRFLGLLTYISSEDFIKNLAVPGTLFSQ
jgi:hypothetical protein